MQLDYKMNCVVQWWL